MTVWPDVYWIGGSPCSGKSSIADGLAAEHGMHVYHCDEHFNAHVATADAGLQPRLHSLRTISWETLFMRPIVEQVADEIAIYREEFGTIVEDLRKLRGEKPLIVEGAALLPELVIPFLPGRSHAIFVIPNGAFQRATYARRPWRHDLLAQCSDPERAWENWMARDEQFGEYVAEEARAASLSVVHVDGSQTVAENTRAVATHFGLR